MPRPHQGARARAAVVVAGLAAVVLAAVAAPADAQRRSSRAPADAVTDRAAQYQIVIAPGWTQSAIPEGTLAAYRSPDGKAQLAVTRVGVGTRWREADDLAAEVERGVERATPGYRRLSRRSGESREVPTFELSYQRSADPGRILSRYLFFGRHSVVVSIGLAARPSRSERRAAEAMLRSFKPYLP